MEKLLIFGPDQKSNYSVLQIVNLIKKNWRNIKWKIKKKIEKKFMKQTF